METRRTAKLAALLCLGLLPLGSCFVRRRIVTAPGKPRGPILTASADELIQRIHAIADPIQSFRLRADISPSVGSLYEGEVKDYATLTGDIMFREPDNIRIRGLDPMMGSTVFDVVSTGDIFHMYIPGKKEFLEGSNSAAASAASKLGNIRPSAFLTSLIIQPPDTEREIPLIEEDTTSGVSTYILLLIRRGSSEQLDRSVQFDRHTLQIVRQKTFDGSGRVTSDTGYSDWKNYDRVPFPSNIDIKRPQDNYEVVLNVASAKINPPEVTPDKFVLEQPPGTSLRK